MKIFGGDNGCHNVKHFVLDVQLTVVASDQSGVGPQVRSTTATFSVRVLDENDNVPTFTQSVRLDYSMN